MPTVGIGVFSGQRDSAQGCKARAEQPGVCITFDPEFKRLSDSFWPFPAIMVLKT